MRVKIVPSKDLKGFYGMNPEAAKHFHLKHYPNNTIEVENRLHPKMRQEVIRHEKIEYDLMKHKHLHYHEADKIASILEKKRR